MPAERAKKSDFSANGHFGAKTKTRADELFAALDLGTNSCRMLIARPDGDEFVVIDAFSKVVHLGKGLEEHGTLSRAAINRTIQALHICQKKLKNHGVTNARLVATEACRRASNGKMFIQQVKAKTGAEAIAQNQQCWPCFVGRCCCTKRDACKQQPHYMKKT